MALLHPGKVPLTFQTALHATFVCLWVVFVGSPGEIRGLPSRIADLYFFIGRIGASILALSKGLEAAELPA